ncbi:hypothetical protein F5H01DRAFT_344896 [Linnemannia elongata]|nr:hypothetical protein F5H01DRAFT_344896 [Linnemannia elongata]
MADPFGWWFMRLMVSIVFSRLYGMSAISGARLSEVRSEDGEGEKKVQEEERERERERKEREREVNTREMNVRNEVRYVQLQRVAYVYGCWKRKSRIESVSNNNKDDCCKVKVKAKRERRESKGERRKGPAELKLEEWKEEKGRKKEEKKKKGKGGCVKCKKGTLAILDLFFVWVGKRKKDRRRQVVCMSSARTLFFLNEWSKEGDDGEGGVETERQI